MKRTILLADDCNQISLLIQHLLSDEYTVVLFKTGFELLNWLNSNKKFDMIISDLNMPDLDGFELIKNIRTSQYYSGIPILILSASEKSESRIKSLEMGANDYIIKPFNPVELKLRIKNLLKSNYYEAA